WQSRYWRGRSGRRSKLSRVLGVRGVRQIGLDAAPRGLDVRIGGALAAGVLLGSRRRIERDIVADRGAGQPVHQAASLASHGARRHSEQDYRKTNQAHAHQTLLPLRDPTPSQQLKGTLVPRNENDLAGLSE